MNLHGIRSSRRDFLFRCAAGMGAAALPGTFSGRAPQSGKASACILLVMEGGPSHMDTFDPKPQLKHWHGTPSATGAEQSSQARARRFAASPFSFRRCGQSGAWMNTEFVHLTGCADDICFFRGARAASANHAAALSHLHTGSLFGGGPALGAWAAYSAPALQSAPLPGFLVLPEPGEGCGRARNWSPGFLPASCRGVEVIPGHTQEPAQAVACCAMEGEGEATRHLYGVGRTSTDEVGRRCLAARRLVEHGARFVVVPVGGWDAHEDLAGDYARCIRAVDRPISGLLTDLKQRGLLASTLVVFTGEFGRSPDTVMRASQRSWGRDHNASAMTMWLAGAGVRAGETVGATDELGREAVEEVHSMEDVRATLLHLLGAEPTSLPGALDHPSPAAPGPGKIIHRLLA